MRLKAFKTQEEAKAFVSRAGAGEENEAGKKFYGIYRGRGGFSGVVDRWWGAGGAEGLTKGVSGVRLKAFKTPEEAEAFASGAGAGEKSEASAAAAERGLARRAPAAVRRQQAVEQPAEGDQGGPVPWWDGLFVRGEEDRWSHLSDRQGASWAYCAAAAAREQEAPAEAAAAQRHRCYRCEETAARRARRDRQEGK